MEPQKRKRGRPPKKREAEALPIQPKLTPEEMLATLELAAQHRSENRILFFNPYPKQRQFIELTASKKEVMLMAANQYGKSDTGAYATAVFMTGMYPKDWPGRRFIRPTRGWIAGESSTLVRDVQQRKLCGEPGVAASFGTGMIPKELFAEKPSLARGVTDAYDTIAVKYLEPDGRWQGGVSVARFKSYEQGRTKFQGETLDWGWADEEPAEDIYSEMLTRIQEGGVMMMTFTPLKGRSRVVLRYLEEPSKDRAYVNATLDEAQHFSPEERARRLEGYMAHERDARAKGIPLLGQGAVYSFPDSLISEPQITDIPPHWFKLWGIDMGIGHPFAAALALIDRDSDIIHIHHTIRQADCLPLQNATAMKYVAAAVPVAWPHDAHQRQQASDTAEELAQVYKRHGLNMLHTHAHFESGGYSREAAVKEIDERARTGRFKVASHLVDWFQEFRLYHRKDGLIVRMEDDLMSATEKIIMMKRFAKQVALGGKVAKKKGLAKAVGAEDSYFGID